MRGVPTLMRREPHRRKQPGDPGRRPGELHGNPGLSSPSHGPPQFRIAHQPVQLLREVGDVSRFDQVAVHAVTDDGRNAVDVRTNPRLLCGHRLDQDPAHRFRPRRKDQDRAPPDVLGHLAVFDRRVMMDLGMAGHGCVELARVGEPTQDLQRPIGIPGATSLKASIRISTPFSLNGNPANSTSLSSPRLSNAPVATSQGKARTTRPARML